MLDISEVAKRTGQPASALRYYEERGLIQSIGRKGLERTYDVDIIERLALISLGRAAGFSLKEIAELFEGDEKTIDRDKLREKADELNRQIRRLSKIRDALRHTADCPAESHMACPNFQRAVAAAGRGLYEALDDVAPRRRVIKVK